MVFFVVTISPKKVGKMFALFECFYFVMQRF
jgi:hypothetical protein